jgi:hypothetical protein
MSMTRIYYAPVSKHHEIAQARTASCMALLCWSWNPSRQSHATGCPGLGNLSRLGSHRLTSRRDSLECTEVSQSW